MATSNATALLKLARDDKNTIAPPIRVVGFSEKYKEVAGKINDILSLESIEYDQYETDYKKPNYKKDNDKKFNSFVNFLNIFIQPGYNLQELRDVLTL